MSLYFSEMGIMRGALILRVTMGILSSCSRSEGPLCHNEYVEELGIYVGLEEYLLVPWTYNLTHTILEVGTGVCGNGNEDNIGLEVETGSTDEGRYLFLDLIVT